MIVTFTACELSDSSVEVLKLNPTENTPKKWFLVLTVFRKSEKKVANAFLNAGGVSWGTYRSVS